MDDLVNIPTDKFIALCNALGAGQRDPDAALRAALQLRAELADVKANVRRYLIGAFYAVTREKQDADDLIARVVKRAEQIDRRSLIEK